MIQNPVLRGFCPDPSIIRAGDDYYIAVSTFEWWPGVRLYHSRDLKNWEQLPSPLRRISQLNMRGNPNNGGIWAPCLSYCGATFYLVYTDVKSQKRPCYNTHNYMVWTDDIAGEWSEPVYLNSTGFDPSLFHDGDRKYLVNMRNGFNGILMQEYDHEKRALVGDARTVYKGTDLGFTEGPHLYRHGGYYFLMTAEGGTGYGHAVTVARSRDIWGPYETDPQNPMLTSRDDPSRMLQKAGHASLVETRGGEWLMVHLCARPVEGRCLTGRETALQPIEWVDGWPRIKGGGHGPLDTFPSPLEGVSFDVEKEPERDDFSGKLGVYYSFLRVPPGEDIDLSGGSLRMIGRESLFSNFRVTLLARRQKESACTAETEMIFVSEMIEHAAGLAYLYNNENFYLLLKTLAGDDETPVLRLVRSIKGSNWEALAETRLPPHERIMLRAENAGLIVRFCYAIEGGDVREIGNGFDSSFLSDEAAPGFTGAHFALYCHDAGNGGHGAEFTYFEVKCRK